MARYTDAVCKLCRREGEKLFLKGEKCLTAKCPLERRNYPPGEHGKKGMRRRKVSDYGKQLREKQKARRIYGVLERQFRRYFKEAQRKKGMTGAMLLILLERRLDNVVYRLGLADSRAQARQLVRHGHITVNGRKVDIPSYLVSEGDEIGVKPSSKKLAYFKDLAERIADKPAPPEWLSIDRETMTGRVLAQPLREQIDVPINEQLIVEFYSR
jgi:small subunit ribosomal protein S4